MLSSKNVVTILTLCCCCLVPGVKAQDVDVTCTKKFCESQPTMCPMLPERCNVQNQTFNGLFLPYPGPCNCCEHCLDNLVEGETCSMGSSTSTVPKTICGNGLSCQNKKCAKIISACTNDQKLYDEKWDKGTLGHMEVRANCDRNGMYDTFKCIPGQTCHCLNEDGGRIFGEIAFSESAKFILTCQCSRDIDRMNKFFERPLKRHEHLRCRPDGSYDQIQCLKKDCFCAKSIDGAPLNYDGAMVDIYSITNKTLPCFDDKFHVANEYYRRCEEVHLKAHEDIVGFEDAGYKIVGTEYPDCQLDGNYNSVQSNETHQYCVYPDGKIIPGYEVAKEDASNMNCKCARSSLLITGSEKPSCCMNGNYNPVQCRRGKCRCVDEDGHQTYKEVSEEEKETLKCNDCN